MFLSNSPKFWQLGYRKIPAIPKGGEGGAAVTILCLTNIPCNMACTKLVVDFFQMWIGLLCDFVRAYSSFVVILIYLGCTLVFVCSLCLKLNYFTNRLLLNYQVLYFRQI